MNTATELLRRVLENLDTHGDIFCGTLEEIRAFLAAEPEAEPVYQIAMAEGSTSTAWIDVAKDVFDDAGMYPEYKRRALYTRPEPARKPMTEAEMYEGTQCGAAYTEGFVNGIRYAEKHHFGVGEDK